MTTSPPQSPLLYSVFSGRYRLYLIMGTAVLGFLYGFPAFYLFINDISLVAVANESISYRYFYSFRILHGESENLFFPQGQLLTAVQILFNWFMDKVLAIPPHDLHLRMDAFGYTTLAINWLVALVAICAAFRSTSLTTSDRLTFTAVTLFVVYGTRSGISAAITPDYYGLE